MKFEFKLGVIVSSMLLVNLQMLIVTLILAGAGTIDGMYYPLNILAFAYLCIGAIGHVRGTYSAYFEMDDPYVLGKPIENPKSFAQAFDLTRNPVTLGIVWRFKKEWHYMKKTANFDFKY